MSTHAHKPWPMKWVLLAIVICLLPYTWVSLRYRKDRPAAEPSADLIARNSPAAHRHLQLKAERPAPPSTETPRDAFAIGRATLAPLPAGLPKGLLDIIGATPRLPASVNLVSTSGEVRAGEAISLQFTCHLASDRELIEGADIYIKENAIVILPSLEIVAPGLQTRSLNERIRITFPANTLKPGSYDVRLMAASNGQNWHWTVR